MGQRVVEKSKIRAGTIELNGVRLSYFETGTSRPDKPTLVFVHATGFHGRVWDRIIEGFPGYHTLALEQRGHGRSENVPITHWREVGDDVAAFADALGVTKAIGIGHSMGAHALVDAAGKGGVFARLILLDPVIAAPEAYDDEPSVVFEGGHPSAKRKNHFASPEEMIERLLPKSSFALFERRILEDYCRYGLVPVESGGYELACPPEMEASVYMTARTNGAVYDSIRSLAIPVSIVRAQVRVSDGAVPDFSSSPTWPGLVDEFPNAREVHFQDCSHFIPMQMPDRVVQMIEEEIAGWTSS